MKKSIVFICLTIMAIAACEKPIILDSRIYDCELSIIDNSDTHPNAQRLQAELDKLTEIIPGIQAAIMTEDDVIWSGASGMADIPNGIEMQACTKSMVGSISKVFTAVLIMQLEEEALLDISDPLSDYLAASLIDEIPNANEVSIQNLLNHNSGIPDYLDAGFHIDAVNEANYILTQEEKMKLLHGSKSEFPVGERYSYSNSNYVLLGLVIESLRQMDLWTAVDTYIAQPIGLKNTLCGTEEQPIPTGTARPYLAVGSNFIDIYQNSVSDAATGDGGIAANAQDLVIFLDALRNESLISAATYQKMEDLRIPINDDNEFYGLGLEFVETDYGTAIGHSGSTSSYFAIALYIEEEDSTVAFCVNGIIQNEDTFVKIIEFGEALMDISFE